ncbi:MAG: serine/threonine-protein kinase, partial [Acidobacteria bacterium]|nr:serine/threonine-protein kinase [Acidobacteriota bacterium]
MTLSPGGMLSHYRLVEKIGEGGMGVVWKAEDTVLGREVAIKVLADDFAHDAERLARFRQEARLLASLNHLNIAAIYGFEESGGIRYLVLELVPGLTLAERLRRGPLPVDEALTVCRQIAEALEAAHEKGIVHRDLKPGNVKVTPDGKVKVLDFGLAKVFAGDTPDQDSSKSMMLTDAGTRVGVVLGTPAYMSPEQARGKAMDRRTDIWAFGCLLYEMLTGRRAFWGETVSDATAAILRGNPDWGLLPGSTPRAARRLLRRCLTK